MEKINEDFTKSIKENCKCPILGIFKGEINFNKKIINIGYYIPNNNREIEKIDLIDFLSVENDVLGFYTCNKFDFDINNIVEKFKKILSSDITFPIILKFYDDDNVPLFLTPKNNSISMSFSDQQWDYKITANSNEEYLY